MRTREERVTEGRARGKGRLWPAAILAALVVWAALPAHATAQVQGARFTYELCDPGLVGGNPPALDFTISGTVPMHPFDTCAEPGGSVGIQDYGHLEAASANLIVGVPPTPGGFVESETVTGGTAAFVPANHGSFVFESGWPGSDTSDSTRTFRIRTGPEAGPEDGNFTIYLECDPGYAGGCEAGPIAWAHYIAVTEVDPHPPVVSDEGPLLAGGVLRGHQELDAAAADEGGGVTRVEALVNGLPAAAPTIGSCALAQVDNPSYEGTVALTPSPCPARLAASWDLDTAAAPFQDGSNTVQVCASDLATTGPPNTTCSPVQTVEVNDTCAESPVDGGQVLSADFARTGSEATTVGFGRGAEVTGELSDQAGEPVPGATICVEAQMEGVAGEPRPIATATTDAEGGFTYKVAPGPNRRLLVGYRHDSFQIGRTLSVATHAQPTLRLSAGRIDEDGRIKIRGRLPGPDAAGRVLVLQASSLHGRRWLTFRRATTGPHGGYRAGYRFGQTTSTITYRIRSVVPSQTGYDYDAGASRPARVKVRG